MAKDIECYYGRSREMFFQEGVDFNSINNQLVDDGLYKITHLDEFISADQKIPLITHQIYFTSKANPKEIDNVSLNKTIVTLARLNNASNEWKHYFWTNDISSVPASIKAIKNIEIHLIDELKENILWPNLIEVLNQAELESHLFAQASDIVRIMALQILGGIYRDLDNEVYNPQKLIELTRAFNFFAGREYEDELSYIGNAFIGASVAHPIIKTAFSLIYRNFNQAKPEYLQYPCDKLDKLVYETGPSIITMAVFQSFKQNSNDYLIAPPPVFYNSAYAWATTTGSRCSTNNQANLYGYVKGIKIDTIASDMLCGSWLLSKGEIPYPENIKNSLFYERELFRAAQTNDLKSLKYYLKNGVNINTTHTKDVTPLYIAAQNGHIEAIQVLLAHGADVEINVNGYTALFAAVYNGHTKIVQLLLEAGANPGVEISGFTLLAIAKQQKHTDILTILTNYYKQNGEFMTDINYLLLKAAEAGNNPEITYCLKKGADVNSISKEGLTPLYLAVDRGHIKAVKLLLEAGANPEIKYQGNASLYTAIFMGRVEIVKLLLEAGAIFQSDDLYSPLYGASFMRDKSKEHAEIHKLIFDKYWQLLALIPKTINNNKNFEVVIVRYKEDLSWVIKEFGEDIKVTIYNKGFDDLDYLSTNYKIIKVPNVGWLGGTYLLHIANNYYQLADRTLFLQGYPYDQELFLPLIRYQEEVKSVCKNIVAKCKETTLLEQSNELSKLTPADWAASVKYPNFIPLNYTMIDYFHKYIDPNFPLEKPLMMDLGAQFAVDAFKIRVHKQEYYAAMLSEFNITHATADFYQEKAWDPMFKTSNIECYQGDLEELITQEGIDYYAEDQKLITNAQEKMAQEYALDKQIIPLITHQVYVTSTYSPKPIDAVSLKKSILTTTRINQVNDSFKHYIWTNNINIIPAEIKSLKGVEVHLISELQEHSLWNEVIEVLKQAESEKHLFAQASDIIRIIVVQIFGGIYHDLDYEVYRAVELINLTKVFSFMGGKEREALISFICNAFFASIPNHPIINEIVRLIERNFNQANLPEYLQYPCLKPIKMIYDAGSPLFSQAYYRFANQNGNNDIVMPHDVFFNEKYAHYTTPGSLCYAPSEVADLDPIVNGTIIKCIGSDMFCGSWYHNRILLEPIYYKKNVDLYLYKAAEKGNIEAAKLALSNGAEIDNVKTNKVTALYIASQNNHPDFVKFLLANGADSEIKMPFNGMTAMEIAKSNKYNKVIEVLKNKQIDVIKEPEQMTKTIECYFGERNKEIFAQENVDLERSEEKLIADSLKVLAHIDELSIGEPKIPLITHQIYFTSIKSPQEIDKVSLEIARETLIDLNKVSNDWIHYFWTNNVEIVPQVIKNIKNVRVILIDELKNSVLWNELSERLRLAETEKAMFSSSSDILRFMVVYEFGGVYHDVDYKIYNPINLLKLMGIANLLTGKEVIEHLIGSAFIAATPKHPVLHTAINLVKRNLGEDDINIPEYIKYPCTKAEQVIMQTNPFVITIAVLKSINQDDYNDFVMPRPVFYNNEYIRANIPSLKFYTPNKKASLNNSINGIEVATIGADPFSGSWGSNEAHRIINYGPNVTSNAYRIDYLLKSVAGGYIQIIEQNLNDDLSVEALRSNSIPLYASVQLNNIKIATLLLSKGANPNFVTNQGYTSLFMATQNQNIEIIRLLLEFKADPNIKQSNGATALCIAAQKGYVEIMKLLLDAGADKTVTIQGFTLEAIAQGFPEVIALLRNYNNEVKINKSIECYYDRGIEMFQQEEIDFDELNPKFMSASFDVLANLDIYPTTELKIPKITHQFYGTSNISPKEIDNVSLKITIDTLLTLNEESDDWVHYIWTNNIEIIPGSIKNIKHVKVELINGFNDSLLWNELNQMLERANTDRGLFSPASDIVRYTALQKFGGVYRDLDCRIYNPINLSKLMGISNLLVGKEGDHTTAYIGSAFVAATPNHLVVNTALDLIKRNLNKLLGTPEYVQYPCLNLDKIVYETGPAVITMAFFKSANKNGNIDLVMPHQVFFNTEYIRYITPGSRCSSPDKVASLENYVNGVKIQTIAADMLCGSWYIWNNYYRNIIDYGKHITSFHFRESKLFEAAEKGNAPLVEYFSSNGENIDTVKQLGVTPLYVAAQNGYLEVVDILLRRGANVNFTRGNGLNALAIAAMNGHKAVVDKLINAGAIVLDSIMEAMKEQYPEAVKLFSNIDNNALLLEAAVKGDDKAITKYLDAGADIENKNIGDNASALLYAVWYGHIDAVKVLIKRGANINIFNDKFGFPLYISAKLGYSEITKMLLNAGADKEMTFKGRSALYAAIHDGQVKDVEQLLDAGAVIQNDELYTPLFTAAYIKDNSENNQKIHELVMNKYWQSLEAIPKSSEDFEVVVVRYKEDLSWVIKEFGENVKVIIYNKGLDDLGYLPTNYQIITIPNVGWLGGTYLLHIANNYYNLAANTLFLQGYPYDQEVFLPLLRYQESIATTCKNIVAKCQETTLLEQSNILSSRTPEDWAASKYKNFTPPTYTMIDYFHKYIDPNFSLEKPLMIDLGAQFSAKAINIRNSHSQKEYEAMLLEFNKTYAEADFFQEKAWDPLFQVSISNQLITNILGRHNNSKTALDGLGKLEQQLTKMELCLRENDSSVDYAGICGQIEI